jgi:sec-independent protein translocase protein TatC
MSNIGNKLISAIKEKGQNIESEMSFFEHIEALRWHLIRACLAIVVFTGVAFYYYDFIWNKIIMAPMDVNFWTYRRMCDLGAFLHMDGFCITKIPGHLINTEMAGQFTLQINSSIIIGIMLGFPYLLWELWRFIKPALHERERKAASGFVFYATILFLIGVMFGYYVIAPESIAFLANYQVSTNIENLFSIDSYLSSVSTLTLATGVVFELPMVVFILSSLGILKPAFMRSTRRYAIIIILVVAAIITPTPDMLTMSIVSAPLLLLYEVGIIVSAVVDRRRVKRDKENDISVS